MIECRELLTNPFARASGAQVRTTSWSWCIYIRLPHVLFDTSFSTYVQELYEKSLEQPDEFWREQAHKYLHWFQDFDRVSQGTFEQGDIAWFLNGKTNASVCCIDQHLPARQNQTAIIWEGDEPSESKYITYKELYQDVCRLANAMRAQGVKKGDIVMIYMPMVCK